MISLLFYFWQNSWLQQQTMCPTAHIMVVVNLWWYNCAGQVSCIFHNIWKISRSIALTLITRHRYKFLCGVFTFFSAVFVIKHSWQEQTSKWTKQFNYCRQHLFNTILREDCRPRSAPLEMVLLKCLGTKKMCLPKCVISYLSRCIKAHWMWHFVQTHHCNHQLYYRYFMKQAL